MKNVMINDHDHVQKKDLHYLTIAFYIDKLIPMQNHDEVEFQLNLLNYTKMTKFNQIKTKKIGVLNLKQ